jgi:hypothetical protein
MYIVDKHKDYYDYVSHVYGVDKDTTFDRRGSCELSLNELIRKVLDVKRYYYDNRRFILEAGFTQYLFAFTDVKRKPVNNPSAMWEEVKYVPRKGNNIISSEYIYDGELKLEHVYNANEHLGKKELSIFIEWIHPMYYYHNDLIHRKGFDCDSLKNIITIPDDLYDRYCIELPILKNLKIPDFINAEDIWKSLSSYISSKYNDKTIEIKLTDEEKAVNHGFDKRESFRPHIKGGNQNDF